MVINVLTWRPQYIFLITSRKRIHIFLLQDLTEENQPIPYSSFKLRKFILGIPETVSQKVEENCLVWEHFYENKNLQVPREQHLR
jgi:hypothetical protein